MELIIFTGIIIIIIMGIKNENLKNEASILKKENKKYKKLKYCPHCGKSIIDNNCNFNNRIILDNFVFYIILSIYLVLNP